jgi:hypothetical protein
MRGEEGYSGVEPTRIKKKRKAKPKTRSIAFLG